MKTAIEPGKLQRAASSTQHPNGEGAQLPISKKSQKPRARLQIPLGVSQFRNDDYDPSNVPRFSNPCFSFFSGEADSNELLNLGSIPIDCDPSVR